MESQLSLRGRSFRWRMPKLDFRSCVYLPLPACHICYRSHTIYQAAEDYDASVEWALASFAAGDGGIK